MDNRRVFAFLSNRLASGQAAVLVTVIAVEGSSMRGPGTHMGVSEDGTFIGSLSGGCIENAVVAEALEALGEARARTVRFGAGSRYIDIKLPCGGGLDIHFLPLEDTNLVARCLTAIDARKPFSLRFDLDSNEASFSTKWRATEHRAEERVSYIGHQPEPKLTIIGHGATVLSLAKLARQMDLTVEVFSPDEELLESLDDNEATTMRLATPADTMPITADPWTAFIFLFHDHDWEIALMAHAMQQPHFYLGAMGGRKAHAFRIKALRELGRSDQAIDAIHAPIGLFHSSRDPDTLALSTLGQVIEAYHRQDFKNAEG
ncbi:XdhC family protein [Pontixanthobacter aestiaquae]|uniref:XdhC family protein n=1 Tax=Pontixanthobacter aestiaquae TaxID=1509367 RepID=A0A844Z7B0_9SPHN|nr:XdhC family protein [Pontixanthobacter aestiaquae]MDN3647225.1 XdhC family protein [Pontixanthobacter aestiaquae]MXO81799.1 XdhC family protein [Pontixanthobacter aestiaquae]